MVVLWILYTIHSIIHRCIQSVFQILLYVALFLTVAYKLSWFERWVWYCLENEASNIVNGAQVTIGSFEINWTGIFEGKIIGHGSNIVIHTPQRQQWGWEAPLIARVGKATVEANVPITLFNLLILGREIPIEAYTIVLSDIQCFIERRDSVINVYLLNPTLKLPPPPFPATTDSKAENKCNVTDDKRSIPQNDLHNDEVLPESSNNVQSNNNETGRTSDVSKKIKTTERHVETSLPDEQAKILVNEMLTSLQDLGRAAKRGQLPGAIKQQGLELVDRLKGLKGQDSSNVEEGLKVIQQFGKVAVESIQSAPQRIMPQADSTKTSKEVLVRVGRIEINDMRIFTKDSWIKAPKSAPNSTKADVATQQQHDYYDTSSSSSQTFTTTKDSNPTVVVTTKDYNSESTIHPTPDNLHHHHHHSDEGWNKPIFIDKMVVRASELCPPMSMKDNQELPAIYQSADRVVDVVWRRLLAEMAKSNTGKFFSAAMGEMISVMMTNPQPTAAAAASGSSSSSSMLSSGDL